VCVCVCVCVSVCARETAEFTRTCIASAASSAVVSNSDLS
jgi:hypothetical protein